MAERPQGTKMTHIPPFRRFSPLDFERLCLWLVRREGYERAEHLGAGAGEQGRHIVAWNDGRRVLFHCNRANRLDLGLALEEIQRLASLPQEDRSDEIVFVVSAISIPTPQKAPNTTSQVAFEAQNPNSPATSSISPGAMS